MQGKWWTWRPHSGLSEIFSPVLTWSLLLGLGNQQSDLLTSVDCADKQGAVEGEAPANGVLGGACRGHLLLPRVPEALFLLRAESCVYTLTGHPQKCLQANETSFILFPEKSYQREQLFIKCMTLEINIILGAMLEMNQCQLFCVLLRDWFQVFHNCNKCFFRTVCIFPCR